MTFSKDNLVLLVLRVSSRCLIYKVHAAEERRFFEFTTVQPVCQALFSFRRNFCFNSEPSSAQVVRSELIYVTTSSSACQELSSPFFQLPLSVFPVPAALFEAACIQYHFSPQLSTLFFNFFDIFFHSFYHPGSCANSKNVLP